MRSVRIWPAAASTTCACPTPSSSSDVPAEALLARLAPLIDDLKASGGYVTADVIDVEPGDARPRRDARALQHRALARRRRSPAHRRRPRPVSRASAGAAGLRHRSRGRRSDSGPARHAPLVRSRAAIAGSARSGYSRIRPAGRLTTRRAARTATSSRCASGPRTSGRLPRRVLVTLRLRASGLDAVLLDIEGTTTPLAFVHEALFPFARRALESFVRAHVDRPEFAARRSTPSRRLAE